MLVGLATGVVFGLALQLIYGSDSQVLKDSIQWFNIVGNGYVQLLQMIVMPLVFASILSAVARLLDVDVDNINTGNVSTANGKLYFAGDSWGKLAS